jgi:heptosyltransferase-2
VNRVIIFAPNWLGDAVMALPAIADLRRGSPRATIAIAARQRVALLFRMVREIDQIIELPDVVEKGSLFPGSTLEKTTPEPSFDTAILLPNSFRAAIIARRAGIPERWGYRTSWRGLLLTRAVARAPAGMHQVEYYQHLVRALGFPNGPSEPRLDVSPEVRAAGARTLEQAGWDGRAPLIVLAPGAALGGARRWAPQSYAALARELAGDGVRPVLIGSASDAPTGCAIESALGDLTTVVNLIGRTDLSTLAGVLANARGLVTNDSGAMHLGAAIGTPVTALLGPTDERVTGPRAAHASRSQPIVLTHSVWCRPCRLRECPLDHACMRGIEVDAVAEAARRML